MPRTAKTITPCARTTKGSGREERKSLCFLSQSTQGSQRKTIMTTGDINELTSRIISAAMKVHSAIGPGLLESVYQRCLRIELEDAGITVASEVAIPVSYAGRVVSEDGFRIDLLVEDTVIVELKSVEEVKPVHKKQLLTYLRLTNKSIGLLINFNEVLLKNGITRVINQPAVKDK